MLSDHFRLGEAMQIVRSGCIALARLIRLWLHSIYICRCVDDAPKCENVCVFGVWEREPMRERGWLCVVVMSKAKRTTSNS